MGATVRAAGVDHRRPMADGCPRRGSSAPCSGLCRAVRANARRAMDACTVLAHVGLEGPIAAIADGSRRNDPVLPVLD